jgi:hypothetical protein
MQIWDGLASVCSGGLVMGGAEAGGAPVRQRGWAGYERAAHSPEGDRFGWLLDFRAAAPYGGQGGAWRRVPSCGCWSVISAVWAARWSTWEAFMVLESLLLPRSWRRLRRSTSVFTSPVVRGVVAGDFMDGGLYSGKSIARRGRWR